MTPAVDARTLALVLLIASLALLATAQAAPWREERFGLFEFTLTYAAYPWGHQLEASTGGGDEVERRTWYDDDLRLNVGKGEPVDAGTRFLLGSVLPLVVLAGTALLVAIGALTLGRARRATVAGSALAAGALVLAMVCFHIGTSALYAEELPDTRPETTAWILLPILAALAGAAAALLQVLQPPATMSQAPPPGAP